MIIMILLTTFSSRTPTKHPMLWPFISAKISYAPFEGHQ